MTLPPRPSDPAGPLVQSWRGSVQAALGVFEGQAQTWCLRGARMRTRSGLMAEWARIASFPEPFGGTWDALRDALSDLPEGGTFLVLEADQLLQDASPEEALTLWRVLDTVREDLHPRPFRLMLQAEDDAYDTLVAGLRALGLDQAERAR